VSATDRFDEIFNLIEKGTKKDCLKAMALTATLLIRFLYSYTFEKE